MENKELTKVHFEIFASHYPVDQMTVEMIFNYAFDKGFQLGNMKPQMLIKTVSIFREEIQGMKQLQDVICMQNRLDISTYNMYFDSFCSEQELNKKTYATISEVIQHLRNWIKKKCSEHKTVFKSSNGKL